MQGFKRAKRNSSQAQNDNFCRRIRVSSNKDESHNPPNPLFAKGELFPNHPPLIYTGQASRENYHFKSAKKSR